MVNGRLSRQGWAGESGQAFMVGQGKVDSQAGNEDRGRQGRAGHAGQADRPGRLGRSCLSSKAEQARTGR